MMYGFGDSNKPLGESVALVEEMVCDYITGLADAASAQALLRCGANKPAAEDVVTVVRKDPARFARAKELILASEETKRSIKAFNQDEKDLGGV